MKRIKSRWNVYTLTRPKERRYDNTRFDKVDCSVRRGEMLKLFAIIEICLQSSLHFGCEQTCVNNYIKSVKDEKKYIAIQKG